VTERPQLWVFAGPNGAGKSTLAAKYIAGRIPIVNPDVLAREIAPGNYDPAVMLRAGRLAIDQRRAMLAASETFAIETTLTGRGEIAFMQQARAAGYKVNLVFIGLNQVEDSRARVSTRVIAGGHPVPDADLSRRFARSLGNLPWAMRIAHRSIILDNTGKRYRLVLNRGRNHNRFVSRSLPAWAKSAIPTVLRHSPEMGMEL
jgi:predicted ABC-type ATPase|tara:strand:- start:3062 stop:3670 length:609 start_codon:yes stop_codon:yes gene_type:complete